MNNVQVDNSKNWDVAMPLYNLTGRLWQYYIHKPALNNDSNIVNFTCIKASFKFKVNVTGKTTASSNPKDLKTAVPPKYLSDFGRLLEMSLINCEINLILIWSSACAFTNLAHAEHLQ